MSDLSTCSVERHGKYLGETTAWYRKQHGQVFTPPEVARFMAGLLSEPRGEFRLLDPGAGLGSLTMAVCDRMMQSQTRCRFHAHLFETELALAEVLEQNMQHCRCMLEERGHSFTYTIHREDFIVAAAPHLDEQSRLFGSSSPRGFDAVVMNPPYFKIRKESEHARLMGQIIHGQPNAYALFLAMAALLLKPDGEMVAITPRSFCSGLYFREFRRWFFERMSLDHVHLYESRVDLFRESGVLQESVVTKSHRLGRLSPKIRITHSFGRDIGGQQGTLELPREQVIDVAFGEHIVRIPASEVECAIMQVVESLPLSFEETGLRISTGPVVTFRATGLLLQQPNGEPVVPLLMPHNVKPFRTEWPVLRKQHPIFIRDCEESRRRRLLIPARNLVLLKRFTAKEEPRRLVAGCFLCAAGETDLIGLENHLNYVYHVDRELSENETFGVAALFNSRLFDRYFRILSGSTQVNASEIRRLHFPTLDVVATIGSEVRALPHPDSDGIEAAVHGALGLGLPEGFAEAL